MTSDDEKHSGRKCCIIYILNLMKHVYDLWIYTQIHILHNNAHGKDMNPYFLPLVMVSLGSLTLAR